MTLTACGIRPTPILTGAEAPTVSSHTLTIYLVTAAHDGLVRRTRDYTGAVDITTAMNLLLAGPNDEEKKLGLVTELPATSSKAVPVLDVIVMPEDVAPPRTKWAVFQVHCTALASRAKVAGVAPVSDEYCP
ncbi:hypothetical protein SAMN04488074_104415 [Lentzea albidocapillata subsp. violacea]|uniref:Uncharacterized protein n=1 Tax=Lentzea albidocapillata subsp. violacea TaxID=128104 RepID=A0A1G8ZN01_9PSEU|nr:hypothetical protein [Lentzea albidocapillata]SDK16407.1 hypothetical protein SAMN04488074_104415 [Lentzea albidocapillata subsp. violacea]